MLGVCGVGLWCWCVGVLLVCVGRVGSSGVSSGVLCGVSGVIVSGLCGVYTWYIIEKAHNTVRHFLWVLFC